MSGHSVIAPSAAHIWGAPSGCRGYVAMAAAYAEDGDSEPAREGTATHEIVAAMIAAHSRAGIDYPTADLVVGRPASNGVIFDADMYDAADLYAKDVVNVMYSSGVMTPGVEQRVTAAAIHELSAGTPDCFIYDAHRRTLYIWDLKYGFGVVDVFENWQLINYYAGIKQTLGINGIDDQSLTVKFRIVQPRAFHRDGPIREWLTTGAALRPLVNQLHHGAHEALAPNAATRSGAHCRYCPARTHCTAAIEAGVSLYEAAGLPLPVEMSPTAVAAQYTITVRAAAHLKSMAAGLEEQIKSMIRRGVNVPGYLAQTGYGRERWAAPAADVIKLGDMLNIDLRTGDAVTPAQAKKLGVQPDVIAAYSERPASGVSIVADDGRKARAIFT